MLDWADFVNSYKWWHPSRSAGTIAKPLTKTSEYYLHNIQSPTEDSDVEVGLLGHQFQLEKSISPEEPGEYVYSGISWKVVSDQAIAKAAFVKVVKADVGQLTVKQDE